VARVTTLDAQIKFLAPVLNQFSVPGATVNSNGATPVSTIVKKYDGHTYLFAQADMTPLGASAGTQTITVPGVSVGQGIQLLLGENRTLTAGSNGTITDRYAGGQLHIYKIG
jgi:hypothetical protein